MADTTVPYSTGETTSATPRSPSCGDRRPLPAGALRPAADAAPGAARRGPGHPRGHRGVRRRSSASAAAEVDGVATFYTMYKRRPVGDYHVGVCTNTLCAVMGGDLIFERLKEHLDVGNDETTEDGKDHPRARRVQRRLRLRAGDDGQLGVHGQPDPGVGHRSWSTTCAPAGRSSSTRGAAICTWREAERVLAGFPDGLADEGPTAGPASLVGLEIARERGWTAPPGDTRQPRRPPAARRSRPTQADTTRAESETKVAESPADVSTAERRRGRTGTTSDRHADSGPHRQLGRRPLLDARAYEPAAATTRCKTRWGWSPDEIIEAVKDSGLRGRGGAGFPTGMKWGFIPQDNPKPKYLVVNADESEPGTCKDIPLMMASPHTLVEGVIISSYAIRANTPFIYVRGEVLHVVRRLQRAVAGGLPAPATSARTSTARATTSTWSSTPAPAPTSAARRPRCSTRSRAVAASRGCGRRSPRSPASTPARRSSTTSSRSRRCRASSPTAPTGSPRWAPRSPRATTIYSLSGHVKKPGPVRSAAGHHAARADRPRPAACARATS